MKPRIIRHPNCVNEDGVRIAGTWVCWGEVGGISGKTPTEAYNRHQKAIEEIQEAKNLRSLFYKGE